MEIEMETVNVQALLEEVLDTVAPLAEEHGSVLTLAGNECAREIMTNAERVRQVLTNLMAYTIERGGSRRIEVRCSGEPDGGAMIELDSQDTSTPPDALPRMLNEFIRIEDSVECESDLEFCQRLAELLHATLEVAAPAGGGSTFRLTLPKAPHGA